MYDNFPYSNFHDLNTDWIVKKIKDVETSEANAKASEEASAESATASALSADQAHASELNAEESAQNAHYSEEYVTDAKNQIVLLQARVDNIVPSGVQTQGNTELIDVRVAENGLIYDSAGNAVRGQTGALNTVLFEYNTYDLLQLNSKTKNTSATSNGVTYSWTENNKCHISGTATAFSASIMVDSPSSIPNGLELGKPYNIKVSLPSNCGLRITEYTANNTERITDVANNRTFTFGTDTIGVTVRFYVSSGATVNGTAVASIINTLSNEELANTLVSINEKTNKDSDIVWFPNKSIGTSGAIQNNNYTGISSTIKVSEGTVITNESVYTDVNGYYLIFYINRYDESMHFIERIQLYTSDSFTVDSTTKYIVFGFGRGSSSGVTFSQADIQNYWKATIVNAIGKYSDIEDSKNSGNGILNIFNRIAEVTNESRNGITYAWTGKECHVTGTASSASYNNAYNGLLPPELKRSKKYHMIYNQDLMTGSLHIRILWYDKSNTLIQTDSKPYSYSFTVPENALTFIIRLYVANGMTIDTVVSNIKIVEEQEQTMFPGHIISFIDDDTTTTEYVTRYYDSCKRNGINGSYAVITGHWDEGVTDPDVLLDYEDDGMAMIMHCNLQSNSVAPEWYNKDYDACRKNLFTCVRKMNEKGFVNFRYWVTPSGVIDKQFQKIGTDAGAKCIISSANYTINYMGDDDKKYIKRCSINPSTNNDTDPTVNGTMANAKKWIDDLMALDSGWLIITSHYSEWNGIQNWNNTVDNTGYPIGYTRMNELMQYAVNSGAEILTIPEAFTSYETILDANKERYNKAI